jgi:hypothetical protein
VNPNDGRGGRLGNVRRAPFGGGGGKSEFQR